MKQISRNVWIFGLILITLLLAACGDSTRVSDPAEFVTPRPAATPTQEIITPVVHITTPPATNPTTTVLATTAASTARPTTVAPTSTSGSGWGGTISLSDNGKTINLKLNEHVLVRLEATGAGETWYWSMVESDPTIVRGIESVAIPKGSQGYIQAFKTGKTTMTATPACFKSQPNCTLPALSFKAEIVVS